MLKISKTIFEKKKMDKYLSIFSKNQKHFWKNVIIWYLSLSNSWRTCRCLFVRCLCYYVIIYHVIYNQCIKHHILAAIMLTIIENALKIIDTIITRHNSILVWLLLCLRSLKNILKLFDTIITRHNSILVWLLLCLQTLKIP